MLISVYYSGIKSPLDGYMMLDSSLIDTIYVTKEYLDDNFCGYRVSLPPTYLFSNSYIFTKSHLFSSSDEFSESFQLSSNNRFSDLYTEKTKPSKVLNTISLSLTFIQMRSVSFSYSFSFSNSFYFSFDEYNETFRLISTQTVFIFNLPYIIHYFSQTYIKMYLPIEKMKKKAISKEQLIGIVCGSVSAFFLLVYIIITIYRKKKYVDIESNDFYSISSSFDQIENNKENSQAMNDKQNDDFTSSSSNESDIDFWI